jgi:hypothetical protein
MVTEILEIIYLLFLSDLGYINLDFSSNLTILYAGVVGFVCGHIVKYAMRKVKK